MALLLRRRRHLLAHASDAADRLGNPAQCRLHSLDTVHAVPRDLLTTVRRTDRTLCPGAQRRDDVMDFLGRGTSTLGQRTHLIRHHGKPAPLFAGACRFNGGIERQQVGLLGNRRDHIDHAADRLGLLGQGVHRLANVIDGIAHAAHGFQALQGQLAALLRQLVGITRCVRRALHVVGNLLDGRRHLRNGSGGLVGLVALAVEHLGLGIGQVGRLRRPRLHPDPGIHQAGQGRLQACLLTDDGQIELALQARVIAVGQRHQRAGEGLGMLGQRVADGLVLPVLDQIPGQQQAGHQHPKRRISRQPQVARRRQQARTDQGPPVAQAMPKPGRPRHRRATGPQASVQRLGAADLLAGGHRAHRLVAADAALFVDGRDIGTDPVVIAVFRPVLDHAHPGFALFDGFPHVAEHRWRHVRVAHQVMGLADQLVVGEPADRHESVVAVGYAAVEVRSGNQALIVRKSSFVLSDGQIHAHLGQSLQD